MLGLLGKHLRDVEERDERREVGHEEGDEHRLPLLLVIQVVHDGRSHLAEDPGALTMRLYTHRTLGSMRESLLLTKD